MRCKKHLIDHSSSVGVCATCLRERLLAVIAAQSQAQEDSDQAHQKPNINFPRSVSPYISRRKSDTSSATWHHHSIRSYHSLPDPKFFSTPQIGPTRGLIIDQYKKKKSNKFGFFSSLFRSKSSKLITHSSSTTATSSPVWLPNIFAGKKQSRMFYSNDSVKNTRGSILKPIDHRNIGMSPNNSVKNERNSSLKPISHRDRGMSPNDSVKNVKNVKNVRGYILKSIGHRDRGMSPLDSDDESGYASDEWRQTPRRSTPAASVGRRCGGRSTQLSRNVSGISFCLSPMVRGGGAPPEMVVSGDIRVPITTAFCKSRSRKLADIGRSSHHR
ncbi:hypothetical protein Leryth_007179 [Lithospermum erythrorhizon]|nr:hypothetical protein Leryth_007179 [Lithospermum erythrorhizon]